MPDLLPVFPLGTVLFPGARLPVHVFEERYRQLVRDLMERGQPAAFGVVAIKRGLEVGDDQPQLYDVGCVAVVRRVEGYPDGRFDVETTGGRRFRVDAFETSLPYLRAYVSPLDEDVGDDIDSAASAALTALVAYQNALRSALGEAVEFPEPSDDPHELSYVAARSLKIDLNEKQQLLESRSDAERLEAVTRLLRRETGLLTHAIAAPHGERRSAGPFSLN